MSSASWAPRPDVTRRAEARVQATEPETEDDQEPFSDIGWEASGWNLLPPPVEGPPPTAQPQAAAGDRLDHVDPPWAVGQTGSGWPTQTGTVEPDSLAEVAAPATADRDNLDRDSPGRSAPQDAAPPREVQHSLPLSHTSTRDPDQRRPAQVEPMSTQAVRAPFEVDPPGRSDPTTSSLQEPGVARPRRAPRFGLGIQSWSVRRLAIMSTLVLVLAVLTGYLASAVQPTVYAAQADVLYEVTGSAQEGERQLATQEVLLGSRGVLAPAAERFDVPLRELTRSQRVEQIAGSQVLRTEVRNQDPALAVQLAQAIADSYVGSVSSGELDTGVEQERRLRDEITDLSITVATGRARLEQIAAARAAAVGQGGALAATPEERQLQLQDTGLSQRISALQAQLTEILVARENANSARVLTPAYLLDEPVGPRPLRAAAAGALLGILLIAGLLALASRRRPGEPGAVTHRREPASFAAGAGRGSTAGRPS